MMSTTNGLFETRLLVACLSSNKAPYTSTELRWLLNQGPDWDRLLTLAGFHGLLPLLTQALEGAGWVGVPGEVREKLLRRNTWHVADNLLKIRVLVELNHHFESRQLELVNWKGFTLAASLYAKPTLREFCDLDFLVAEHEVEEAIGVLMTIGFKRHMRIESERATRLIAKYNSELCFLRERDLIYVELHNEFLPQRFGGWQDIQPALNRATMQEFPGCKLLALHPEDLLLSLCSHGIKHHWGRLKWLADIAQFVEMYRHSLDWQRMLRNLRGLGQIHAVLHSFLLAEAVFGVRLPHELSEMKVPPRLAELTGRRAAALLGNVSSSEMSERETAEQLGLLFPGKVQSLLFSLRRLSEPQERDFAGGSNRFPFLAKIWRLHKQIGWGGIVEKIKVGFGLDPLRR